ncbi:Type I polyketide synthase (PKSs) [Halomicronema hongdechloris C2206]|uniref:Phenolphthiocerol/phthiocerol polyketide synthase subunit E n=1 Tax=Halomicronema hongdechloris C2206 TaxID=1641165 RepID=A0A1Z3HL55_9CYAN|nr:type I polyketide synthase [Halomicronema hongdechloris]ASC71034.1 Type I polyketide synthase (PKSs) [Halomicronema hongdechloris C2206]
MATDLQINKNISPKDEIAIIAMSGCFPRANNAEQLWRNLQGGIESISFFADEELLAAGVDDNMLNDPHYVKAGTLLDDIDKFDADFFGFTPREAEIADPQQRLLIECVWEALEQAGYDPEQYSGPIGLFTGAGLSTYSLNNLYPNRQWLESAAGLEVLTRNDKDYLSTSISYKLNLKGPSLTIQTACSTSLVAVHLACQSLLNGESDLAIAGGVTIKVPQKTGYLYQEGGIASADGHCRAFDANAKGTVFGNGVGVVALKRLEDALTEGDRILAVIKGSAINNDGAQKIGYTAPSIDGQAAVISEALAVAEVNPDTISYIEAHGTGTSLGDPIELAALTQAFRTGTDRCGFCAIGSVKTNIGHLDTAAGVAGLIKTVLALQHRQIPPSLHFEQPNPQIDFEASPFYVNTRLQPWAANGTPRRAGISSFGIGGTNAHVVLEEAPALPPSGASRPWQILPLSAKTPTALETATTQLADYLQQHPDANLADVAYTLQVGRRPFEHRRLVVCRNLETAVQALGDPTSPSVLTQLSDDEHQPIVFMFSGQGAQYLHMGRELYEHEPVFREQVDGCCELLHPHLGLDLRQVLYGDSPKDDAAAQLRQTAIAQPALFVVEYALAQLWMSWGIRPEAMIGHSIGEYVAACLAGIFSLEDALTLVAARGRLMQQMPAGAMLSVPLSGAEIHPWLSDQLSLASLNAPALSVVSGSDAAIEALQQRLSDHGIKSRRLHTSHAFHSSMMEPVLRPFMAQLQSLSLNPPQIPVVSNLTGTWLTAAKATNPSYWANHLRQPVQFAAGMATLLQEPKYIFLEVGPGRTLSTFAKQQTTEALVLTSLRHPQDTTSDQAGILTTLGRLWLAGVPANWSGFTAHESRRRVLLPTYPFERKRYWIDPPQGSAESSQPHLSELKRKPDPADWFYLPTWQRTLLPKPDVNQPHHWLLLTDTCGIGDGLANRLNQLGHSVITVSLGKQFSQLSSICYEINPQEQQSYDALIQALKASDQIPEKIVHLWGVTAESETPLPSSAQEFQPYQKRGFYSLLFLTRAIAQQLTNPLEIYVVTDQIYEVTGGESLIPAKATVLGPCKVIPQEYPQLTCRSIDIQVPKSAYIDTLIEQLLAECTTSSTHPVIAYRGNHRWTQTFEPIRLPATQKIHPRLRQNGIYLLVGDLVDGMGLSFAQSLIEKTKAKIAFIGHLGLPHRESWQAWLDTHDGSDQTSDIIRQLQVLEDKAEVFLIEFNDTQTDQIQAAIHQVLEHFGKIHGVLYLPEITAEKAVSAIEEIDLTDCEQHFQKIYSLSSLCNALQGISLDFCLLQSSMSCVLGGLGLANYAAAYLSMDAIIHQQNQMQKEIPWLSVNRQAFHTGRKTESQSESLPDLSTELAMTPGEVWEAFLRVLARVDAGQVVASTGDLQQRFDQSIKLEPKKSLEVLKQHARPNVQSTYVAPQNDVEVAIAHIWQTLIGIEQVGIHDNFFELGGHSLLAVQVTSRLREIFQVDLPLKAILFDAPTVAGLATIISEQQSHLETEHEIAAFVEEIQNLSPEEIDQALAQEL